MWIVKDKDGTKLLFEKKPVRFKDGWKSDGRFFIIGSFPLIEVPAFIDLMEWKDAPIQVKFEIKKK